MSLSLKQVRYFIAAAESGQMSQAAVELGVSQSAVTSSIQQLESALAIRLFHRHPSGVSLTPDGSRFLQHARHIMAAVNEALRVPRTADSALSGKVKVGVTYTVAGHFLPPHHARFMRTFPNVALDLYEAARPVIEDALLEGALEIGIVLVSNLEHRARLTSETLFRSRRQLWLPADHRLLQHATVPLAEVADEPYVMLTVDEASQTAGRYWARTPYRPNVIFRTASVEAVRSMVAAGMGISILSDMVYRPWSLDGQRIETRRLDGDIPSMDVGLAWRAGAVLSPAAQALRDFFVLAFQSGNQGFPA